ncbi:ubiquitin-conjugating enzyme E2Q-like protein CG4502 [Strongylocentrotus purpuratus]|uniref:E2 ubiquitin-conjugating enzyme n=1 Tax=Strongylocentrotus purpuratus TaxID=7668 RepID=A0A7M7REU6_STRPU|nr:ubiquitin-conjugating enzyme E2Q-like protein CG4502 [Strongylocentrotus purpuratus]|eukprot:XP_795879.2 PREDICTED: ubiquitin-conjugating enzyme E2Q-like protein CG4502 [Strongylocentrotus purpuratus]
MAEFVGKYLCPCLPLANVSGRRSARSKVRALARKRHKNNQGGPLSTSGVEDSVTITRNGSLTIFSISGTGDDVYPYGEALRDKAELPGTVSTAEEKDATPEELKYNVADGTRALSAETLMRMPQPSKAYVSNVRMRRLMKEFKAVTKIIEEARKKEQEEKERYANDEEEDTDPPKEDVSKEVVSSKDESQSECAEEKSGEASKSSESKDSNTSVESPNKSSNETGSGTAEAVAGCSTSTVDDKGENSGDNKEEGAEEGAKKGAEKGAEEGAEEGAEKGAEAVKKALEDGGFMTNEKLTGPPYAVELVNDSLADWNIKLFHVNPKSSLSKDMKKHNYEYILFNMTFPDNFPFVPPFVRVVSPHVEYGYVLDGGAICMELLTPQGWSSSYTIDAVIMQLGATLVAGDGRIVQSSFRSDVPFNKQEAEVSFRAIVETHERYGWHKTPGDNS